MTEPAVGYEEAVLMRLAEATKAVQRIATQTWEPDKFRAAIAADIAEVLRALDQARNDLRRGVEIRSADAARVALREYFARIGYGADEASPQVTHLIVPLPLDPDRFDAQRLSKAFGDVVNRLAIEIQMQNRKYANWLIIAPSSSGVTGNSDVLDFRVHVDATTLSSGIRIYPTGTIAFRRPLYSWHEPKGFALSNTLADLEATALFAREIFGEINASPVQVAIATVVSNAGDWIVSVPGDFGNIEYRRSPSNQALQIFPSEPVVLGFSDFSRDPLIVAQPVLATMKDAYSVIEGS